MSESNELVVGEHRNKTQLNMLEVSHKAGGVAFANMADSLAVAELMSRGGIAIRQHLRGEPGACLAVVLQAIAWNMNPYHVANKSYSVNNQIAYEAQLIQAVIQMRAPIIGRIKTEYKGEGAARQLRVWAKIKSEDGGEEETVDYISPLFEKITPKNSPLWKNDPDQQLHYYSVRAWCRRHFPEIILGVYAPDEITVELPATDYREIDAGESMTSKLDKLAAPAATKAAADPAPAAEKPRRPRGFNTSYALADLVIEDGIIIKSRDDKQIGGGATEEDEAKAQLIVEDGKIVKDVTKQADPRATMPDLPENLDLRKKAEPTKVTSGRVEPEKKADEPRDEAADLRAAEREMASAAGAIDPENDPFADEEEEKKDEPEDPLKAATDEFMRDLDKVKTEEELEGLRKKLVQIFKGVDKKNEHYLRAAAAYPVALNRIRSGGEKQPEPEKKQDSSAAGEGMSAEEEDELEQLVTTMDHSPKGIDLGDLHQVRAYVQGLKAAQKGRAITAVPGVYDDVQAACWRSGHTYRSANPVAE